MKLTARIPALIILFSALLMPSQGHAKNFSMICHQTGAGEITLYVNNNAVAGHLNHGDQLGACQTSAPPLPFLTQTQQIVEINEPPLNWLMAFILPLIILRGLFFKKHLRNR